MTNRVSKKLVSFRNPFILESHETVWPAGDYTIETEEERLKSLSFQAYREVSTTMLVRSRASRWTGKRGGPQGATRYVAIDPAELADALARDSEDVHRAANEGMTST